MGEKEQIKKENNLNNALYIAKTFAVISIVLAHTSYNIIANEYIKAFLSIYQCIGVYIFLILSGYFFNINKYTNIKELLKDKIIKIGIPWFLIGTSSFVIIKILNDGLFDFLALINYLLGNGTYLYYLTILILCYIIYYFVPQNNNKYIYILLLLNISSVLLTSINLFPQEVNSELIIFSYLNPYLNIMNWIGIFSLGVLIRKKVLLEKYKNKIVEKYKIILIFYTIMYGILCIFKFNVISYWSLATLIIGVVSFGAIVTISLKLSSCNFLIDVGKKSFFIYQIHMLFLGIIFNKFFKESAIFAIIRPIICVFTIYLIAWLGQKLAKLFKLEKIYNIVLGIR